MENTSLGSYCLLFYPCIFTTSFYLQKSFQVLLSQGSQWLFEMGKQWQRGDVIYSRPQKENIVRDSTIRNQDQQNSFLYLKHAFIIIEVTAQITHTSLRQIQSLSYYSKVSGKNKFARQICNTHGPFTEKKEGLLWIFRLSSSFNYQVIRSEAAKCSGSFGCMQVYRLYTSIYTYT